MSEDSTTSQQGAGAGAVASPERGGGASTKLLVLFSGLGLIYGFVLGYYTRPTRIPFRDIFGCLGETGNQHDIAFAVLTHIAIYAIVGLVVAGAASFVLARMGLGFDQVVRNQQDFYGATFLIFLALFALWASEDLPGQRGFAFGPGTAPRLFSLLLLGVGIWLTIVALVSKGPRLQSYKLRGPAFVIFAIIFFGIIIRPLGLMVASFFAFFIAALGAKPMRPSDGIITVAYVVGLVLIFLYLFQEITLDLGPGVVTAVSPFIVAIELILSAIVQIGVLIALVLLAVQFLGAVLLGWRGLSTEGPQSSAFARGPLLYAVSGICIVLSLAAYAFVLRQMAGGGSILSPITTATQSPSTIAFTLLALACFALSYLLSRVIAKEMMWNETVIASVLMTAACVITFIYILALPFQLTPPDNAHTVLMQEVREFTPSFQKVCKLPAAT